MEFKYRMILFVLYIYGLVFIVLFSSNRNQTTDGTEFENCHVSINYRSVKKRLNFILF